MFIKKTCPQCRGNRYTTNAAGRSVHCHECGGKGWKPVSTDKDAVADLYPRPGNLHHLVGHF